MIVEPKPSERKYYRHRMTGDRAYRVLVDGVPYMKFGSGPQDRHTLYKEGEWTEDTADYPMSRMQLAEMAYLLVCRYYYYAQNHAKARRKWETLREEERIHFMNHAPEDLKAKKFYEAVMEAGKELVG